MQYDKLLKGGRVVCPATGIDGVMDVAVKDGRIAAIEAEILPNSAREVITVKDKIVLPGMIDTHAHIYTYVSGRFGLPADMAGVDSGVTALVDQGGASCMTMPGFREFIAKPARSRVFSFISAYVVGGLEGHYYPNLYGPENVDVGATVKMAHANPGLVRGVKAHAELGGMARFGLEVLKQAAEIGREADLPVYCHFGQLWPTPETGPNGVDPDEILPLVVPLLRPGDILAHPFTRHPGGFVDRRTGKVHAIVDAALKAGLKVDVGHGSHFSFNMARISLDAGIMPDTLGADMHGYNTRVPPPAGTPSSHPDPEESHPFAGKARFSLTLAMSEMLALGVPFEKVVRMVTTGPAAMLRMDDGIGTLRIGAVADVSVLSDLRGKFRMEDNEGTQVIADRLLQPEFCLREGVRYDATAPILPAAIAA
ncbi:amidohydrolase/deacetylase family metallohydrolase [Roseococcus sp. YIM B11640]|uniref:amidohydrolase/deacetylase family metallohydrolase n=1 Tax=Roseococcus sp. YIM B11640 TaxID=3133973 RepID=UPI003C7DEF25